MNVKKILAALRLCVYALKILFKNQNGARKRLWYE